MRKGVFIALILAVMLLGLPLVGALVAGKDLKLYTEFPPLTRYVRHASFSWPVFLLELACLVWIVGPFAVRSLRWHAERGGARRYPFPWWGWCGFAIGTTAWILAWNRFTWFAPLQSHTFMPLWIAFILVVNGLTVRRSGSCMMVNRTKFFLLLFPLSSVFWWFFEYLNRFVQNWYYVEVVGFSRMDYILFCTLSFSTVLPAVLGTTELLRTYPAFEAAMKNFRPARVPNSRLFPAAVLLAAGFGLAGIAAWPNLLYPLLWVSPALIALCLQALFRQPHVLSGAPRGDWRESWAPVVAALICGFFWEMWNYKSFTKWVYDIPYCYRFLVFEMPILGYAGYFPFGIECAVIGKAASSE